MFKKTILAALMLLCVAATQALAKPIILTTPVYYEVYDMSPNGKWACGAFSDYNYSYYGFRWNLETNEIEMLSSTDESLAWGIADDGTVSGTFKDTEALSSGTPIDMAGYYKDGKWHHLEMPDGTVTYGEGYGISTDGHYMSGMVEVDGVYSPFIWKDGMIYRNCSNGLDGMPWCISPDGQTMAGWAYPSKKGNRRNVLWDANGKQVWLNSCEQAWCGAKNFSPDGKKLVFWGGYKTDDTSQDPQVASIYDVATGNIDYITTPGEVGIYVYDIANSGMVLGGKEFEAGSFVWKDNTFIDGVEYLESRGAGFSDIDMMRDSVTDKPSAVFRSCAISEDENRIAMMYYDSEGELRSMVVMFDDEAGSAQSAPVSLSAKQMQDINAVELKWKKNVAADTPDGYNVYRDGQKVNTALVSDTRYYDNVQTAGTYKYAVEAVYGETLKKSSEVGVTVTDKEVSAPQTLYARQKGVNGARLQWSAPATNYINRTYANMATADVQGFGTAAGIAFEVGIGFEKEDLAMYAGNKITSVQFYPMDASVTGMKVNIYAYDADNNISRIYTQNITQELTVNQFNTVTLDTPVALPDGDMIVAIETPQTTSTSVIGMDWGTCSAGYSDLLRQTTEADFYSFYNASAAQLTPYSVTWLINAVLTPEGASGDADKVDHYTVYADGQSKGTTTDLSHVIGSLADGKHTLGVSATFADGKTSPQATASVDIATKGVDDVVAQTAGGSQVDFSWTNPNTDPTYITYAEGEAKTGPKGPSSNNYGLMAGAIYGRAKLKGYDGYTVKQVRFWPTADAMFTVSVTKNGTTIYEQEVADYVLGTWNYVDLTTPFTIDEKAEYKLIIDCYDVTPNKAPLAIDNTTAYNGYSDIYSLDGDSWASITEAAMHGNWMMGWVIEDPAGAGTSVKGYDIYIDGVKKNTELLTTNEFSYDFGTVDATEHTVSVDVHYETVTDAVKGATTTFTLEGLTSISSATIGKLNMQVGTNYLTVGGSQVSSIEAYSIDGAKVAAAKGDKLNISSLTAGVYVVKAKTANGTITRKVEICK